MSSTAVWRLRSSGPGPPGGKRASASQVFPAPFQSLLDRNFVGRCCRGLQLYGTTLLQSIQHSRLGHRFLCPLTLLETNNEARSLVSWHCVPVKKIGEWCLQWGSFFFIGGMPQRHASTFWKETWKKACKLPFLILFWNSQPNLHAVSMFICAFISWNDLRFDTRGGDCFVVFVSFWR